MSTGPMNEQDEDGSAQPSADLRRQFWVLVGLFNIGLLGVGLGVLLLVFEPGSGVGWPVLGLGLAAGGYGYGKYRRREHRNTSDGPDGRQD